jgi:hypothetical protein
MLANISDVPWEDLAPGDHVLIHWRASPYKEKWVLCRQGSAGAPIVVSGVPGPSGQLPVIDGSGAITRTELNYWNEERGVIKIGGANIPADTLPAYIVIENLDIRSGRPPFTFTNDSSGTQTYANNAAAIYVEKAEHLTIRNCILRDSGNGLFIGAYGGLTQDILIEKNWIYDNGIEGSYYHHNTYTAAIGITYQFNHLGRLRDNCGGNNLKDRSAGLVARYNWIEDGNRQLDLVDAEDSAVLVNHPDYSTTFVTARATARSCTTAATAAPPPTTERAPFTSFTTPSSLPAPATPPSCAFPQTMSPPTCGTTSSTQLPQDPASRCSPNPAPWTSAPTG